MAGIVRQPIDIKSLSGYLRWNVPEIKLPIQIKQVCGPTSLIKAYVLTEPHSLGLGSQTLHTNWPRPTVDNTSSVRSPRVSYCPRLRTRSSVNTVSFTHWERRMFLCLERIAFVRIPKSLVLHSTLWSFWMAGSSKMPQSPRCLQMRDTRCEHSDRCAGSAADMVKVV